MDKWHQYQYGKHDITVHTDHQPLETIFKKSLSKAPRRLQRMMLKLQRYQFTVRYKKGKELYVADTLSRAAVTDQHSSAAKQEYEEFRVEIAATNKTRTRQRPSSSIRAHGDNEWVAFRKKESPRGTEAVLEFPG